MQHDFLTVVIQLHPGCVTWQPLVEAGRLFLTAVFEDSNCIIGFPRQSAQQMMRGNKSAARGLLKRRVRLADEWDLSPIATGTDASFHALKMSERQDERASARENFAKTDWQIQSEAHITIGGRRLPGYLNVSLNMERLKASQRCSLFSAVRALFGRVLDTTDVQLGFAEIAEMSETWTGKYYTGAVQGSVNLHRQVLRRVWSSHRDPMRCFHLVTWCHLLSPEAVQKLGGQEFLDGFVGVTKSKFEDLTNPYPSGHVLLQLSDDIEEFSGPKLLMPFTVDRAAWLYQRFREAEMIV